HRARNGRFIEKLGYFNPVANGQEKRLEFNTERAQWWINQGALPSNRVASLIKEAARAPATAEPEAMPPPAETGTKVDEKTAEPEVKPQAEAGADEETEVKAEAKAGDDKAEAKAEAKQAAPKAEAKAEAKAEPKKVAPKAEAGTDEKPVEAPA